MVQGCLTACCGPEPPDGSTLTAAQSTAFVSQEAAKRRNAGRKQPAAAVRSFLRFLGFRGNIPPGWEAAALAPPQWQYAALPSRLPPEAVAQVRAVYHEGTASSLRNRALLFCLARLGLRTQDVVSLCCEESDWAAGCLALRPGKPPRVRRVPLPHDVGQAIVASRQNGRPQRASRQVFVQSRAPLRALTGAAVWAMGRHAFPRTQMVVPPGGASHLFRQTVAAQMVTRGARCKEVADV
jgi:site-specific recombinase XerD